MTLFPDVVPCSNSMSWTPSGKATCHVATTSLDIVKATSKRETFITDSYLKKNQVTHRQNDISQTVKICCTGIRLSKVLDSREENELFFQNS